MKKILLYAFVLFSSIVFGQQQIPFIKCAEVNYINYQEQLNPGYKANLAHQFQLAKSNHLKSNDTYVIPVVVHIVYNPANPAENIADSVVHNQIDVLNRDYQRLNADSVNLRDTFDFIAGKANIKFRLATIDPDGNPTTGITRTETTYSTFMNYTEFMQGDMSSVERVKATADGGIDPWDQTHYLNIWVCNMAIEFGGQSIPALLGYSTPPTGLPNWPAGSTGGLNDGTVIQYQAFGGEYLSPIEVSGQIIPVNGRTTVHEVGHYLGLRHIWGDGDCTQQDGIDDTPNADAESSGCPIQNTCTDNIQGRDLPDMIENYMDYSNEDCQNTFTNGQVNLMRGVLENQRYDLVHGNPAAVAIQSFTSSVYPNPTNDILVVSIDNTQFSSIKIVGMNGKIVRSLSPTGKYVQLDVSQLDQGVYFLHIQGQNGAKQVKRFVVE